MSELGHFRHYNEGHRSGSPALSGNGKRDMTELTDIWLTRREAGKYLKLGESTLAKLFVSGDGPEAVKVGRSIRYLTADLDHWMIQRRRKSSSDSGLG
jgi:predicted DNA-binding transcriptional regulator AlpA